jgi:hypothetical protein
MVAATPFTAAKPGLAGFGDEGHYPAGGHCPCAPPSDQFFVYME